MSDPNFWIPITLGDQTEEKIQTAIAACHQVHVFTVQTLNDYFFDHAEMYFYGNFRRELNLYVLRENLSRQAQRYSLTRASEKTFPYFNAHKKFEGDKFVAVKPLTRKDYNEIQLQSRQVWRKYMALDSLITTAYGTVFLDESWVEVVQAQCRQREIEFEIVPFLMHSATISLSSEEQRIQFHLHDPHTKFGKLARKEMKKYA